MLFCFDCLMKSVRITASRHNTSGKLVNDEYFIVFYNIILVTEHQIMCTQCKDNIMLDFQVFRISQVLNMKELFNFLYTIFCQVDILLFFIDDKITSLFNILAHNGIHLTEFTTRLAFFQLTRKNIACFI